MAALFNSYRTLAISMAALIAYAYDSNEMCRARIHDALRSRSAIDGAIRPHADDAIVWDRPVD